ncbi:GC-rich sequence DNA-binding factor 1-like [Tropilaelaps mercedesae]|uniref:GC-rich sequence DNA-binding factor 1-like n=1 Tax=Tropilaelaps mercedesae TaxID=418985 RepID=A0A1V9XK54_9ACAR|nr:GC-rich sequence DNA-binding factor 1-like [Tropilaelaps mercedesae]
MSMFRKPTRKVRQRLAHSDSEDEDSHSCVLKTRDDRKKEKDKDERVNSANTLLSFGGGDEEAEGGEVFKVKKSSYSRRIAKELEKERKERKRKDDGKNYGQEQNQLDGSAAIPGFEAEARDDGSGTPAGGGIIVREIPLATDDIDIRIKNTDFRVLSSEELENVKAEIKSNLDEKEGESGSSDAESTNGRRREKSGSSVRFNRDRVSRVLEQGAIPDAATIFALKKQRQQAAGRRNPDEFIPLKEHNNSNDNYSQNNNNSMSAGGHFRDGRLVHEDDDDSGGEEGRVNFSDIRSGKRDEIMRQALGGTRGGSVTHEDQNPDETDRWEKEQIRKGVATLSSGQEFSRSPSPNAEDQDRVSTLPPVQIPVDKSNLTISSVVDRVRNRLQTVQEIVARSQRQHSTADSELEMCVETIQRLEKEMPNLEKAFRFYQEMRTYSMDLIECFDSKMPIINALEGRLLSALAQRAENRMLRRRQDVRDQAEELRPGAIIDTAAKKRAREREGRRVRRKTTRQSAGAAKHNEGMSSDDEEGETERRQLASHREQVLADGSHVFDDVNDDFSQLKVMLTQFEEWKMYFNESYQEAYIPICVLKLVVPFVRLEMLAWNPLENPEAIEKCEWYKELLFFGQKIEDKDESDLNIIPKVVERAILPKLSQYVERVWDPMSASETRNLVRCVRKLADDYPFGRKSKPLATLLSKVFAKLQTALQEDIFIPLATKEIIDNPLCPSSLFFHRQFWSAVKLLQNVLSWHGILAERPLKELAIMGLLNRYLLFALQCTLAHKDAADRAEAVGSMLPTAWLRTEAPGKPPELQMWAQYLQGLLRQLRSDYAPE